VEPPSDYDFKQFVLYVNDKDKRTPQCLSALAALSQNPEMKKETLVQDFGSLVTVPPWLNSVPCLVVKSERRAFKDDACIKYIKDYKHKGAVGYSSFRKGTGHKKAGWD
jgi:hypothetical protein